eukprot:4002123-Amphidinium_carterae.1
MALAAKSGRVHNTGQVASRAREALSDRVKESIGRPPQARMPYKLWQVVLTAMECPPKEWRQGQASHQL